MAKISKKTKNDSILIKSKLTGLGTHHDPSRSIRVTPGQPIQEQVATALYCGSGIARNIVTAYPDGALAKGLVINTDDKQLSAKLLMQFDQDDIVNKVKLAGQYARAYGGAIIYVNCDDGLDPSLPVSPTKIRNIRNITVYSANNIKIQTVESNPDSPRFGQPLVYELTMQTLHSSIRMTVHASRCVYFDGLDCPPDERIKRGGFGLSIFDILIDKIYSHESIYHSVSGIIHRNNQAVYKINDLDRVLSSDTDQLMQERYNLADKFRSNFNAIMLAGDESFEYHTANVAGLADLLDRYTLLLSQISRIPIVVLTGQSPAGLSSTGLSDFRLWISQLEQYYTQNIKQNVEKIAAYYFAAWGIDEPDVWSITTPSLWSLTPEEELSINNGIISSDAGLISSGQYTPEEVAIFRSQPSGHNKPITLTAEGEKVRKISLNHTYSQAMQLQTNPADTDPNN
jgi:phage-related protein (TIGR01555 family)